MPQCATVLTTLSLAALPLQAQTVRIHADNEPTWGSNVALVEELRIGSLAGDEAYTFGHVASVLQAHDGTIWIADRQASEIRHYSSGGTYLRSFGRRGKGPGEFEYLMDMRPTPDGRVAVWDPGNARLHFFDAAGTLVSDQTVPTAGIVGGRNLTSLEVDESVAYLSNPTHGTEDRQRSRHWLKVSATGAILDSIHIARINNEGSQHPIQTVTALSPTGFTVVGRTDRYQFEWRDQSGRQLQLTRDVEPAKYSRAERREAQEQEESFSERNGRPVRNIPATKPLWSSILFDRDGRLWVERYVEGVRVEETDAQRETREAWGAPKREWGQPLVYDVLDLDGVLLGTLTFEGGASAAPSSPITIAWASGMTVWTIERGQFDEHYVVRYRIVPSA